jgi:hypothetical protein
MWSHAHEQPISKFSFQKHQLPVSRIDVSRAEEFCVPLVIQQTLRLEITKTTSLLHKCLFLHIIL